MAAVLIVLTDSVLCDAVTCVVDNYQIKSVYPDHRWEVTLVLWNRVNYLCTHP